MIIDSHCHLQMEDFSNDLPSVLSNAKINGICSFVVVGFDMKSSIAAMHLARKYEFIHPVYGIHPYDTNKYDSSVFNEIEDLIEEYRPVAIGETGLDYYRDYSPGKKQQSFFNEHIRIADKHNLPLVIHVRDAFDDTFEIIKESKRKGDILHCFTGTREDIEHFKVFDIFFGITGIITFKNSPLKNIVNSIPENRLLIETDSPYLAPVPKRGKRNEPANLIHTLKTLAEQKGTDTKTLESLLLRNTQEAYRSKFYECKKGT
ncbi:MAG: YchF/TatD family DNA exonuclease [Proteobacteria bacterium]|nr:YchF/TatD family DNA exonuclease [Pseudomonadota bacterium]